MSDAGGTIVAGARRLPNVFRPCALPLPNLTTVVAAGWAQGRRAAERPRGAGRVAAPPWLFREPHARPGGNYFPLRGWGSHVHPQIRRPGAAGSGLPGRRRRPRPAHRAPSARSRPSGRWRPRPAGRPRAAWPGLGPQWRVSGPYGRPGAPRWAGMSWRPSRRRTRRRPPRPGSWRAGRHAGGPGRGSPGRPAARWPGRARGSRHGAARELRPGVSVRDRRWGVAGVSRAGEIAPRRAHLGMRQPGQGLSWAPSVRTRRRVCQSELFTSRPPSTRVKNFGLGPSPLGAGHRFVCGYAVLCRRAPPSGIGRRPWAESPGSGGASSGRPCATASCQAM